MKPTALDFITITSGRRSMSPRSEVDDHVIEALKPVLRNAHAGIHSLIHGGWSVDLAKSDPRRDGGLAFVILHNNRALSQCMAVWQTRQHVGAWEFFRCFKPPFVDEIAEPAVPWLAVNVIADLRNEMMTMIDAMVILPELADVERCVAWTLIELYWEED